MRKIIVVRTGTYVYEVSMPIVAEMNGKSANNKFLIGKGMF